jgi:hypothetical protein
MKNLSIVWAVLVWFSDFAPRANKSIWIRRWEFIGNLVDNVQSKKLSPNQKNFIKFLKTKSGLI